ncbi:MAG: TM2 domain-containing protein [Myxococcota bacterium]
MKKLWVSYLLCLIFPGMHRIYLDKYFSGVLYFFTLGFFGIGTFIDLLLMPTLVQEANAKYALKMGIISHQAYSHSQGELDPDLQSELQDELSLLFIPARFRKHLRKLYRISHKANHRVQRQQTNVLQQILRAANRHGGTITAHEVVMETGLMPQKAEQYLDQLLAKGFCTVDAEKNGCMAYTFRGLRPKKAASSHTTAAVAEPANP